MKAKKKDTGIGKQGKKSYIQQMKKQDEKMTLQVFTDYACPFCYIAYKMYKEVEKKLSCVITPVYMEIHDDMPPQGADASCLFSDQRRMRMNEHLKQLGAPYGIEPRIGRRLSSSRKAITLRAYLQAHYQEKLESYDNEIYSLYQVEEKDIGDEVLLEAVRKKLEIPETLSLMLFDAEANKKRADDRRYAGINAIHTTPSFKIGRTCYKGVLEEEKLMMLCKKELEDGKK